MIRALNHEEDAEACDGIILGLPGWFGSEQGRRECSEAVRSQSGFVAEESDEVAAFLTVEPRETGVAEITWLAVRADQRGNGLGTALLDQLCAAARADERQLLLVKTRSDRDGPDAEYDQTLAFYLARGFVRVAELDIWGPEDPCLLMAKPL